MSAEHVAVAIVGGGVGGLALGFGLHRRGFDVRVLEASHRPGGNIRSEARSGYLIEWGPNGFLDNEPAMLRLVEALELRGELVAASDTATRRSVVRGGALRALPHGPGGFLTSDVLRLGGRLRVLLEWAQPARRGGGDESVLAFATRRIGREAAEVLVDAMVTGVFAGAADQLSLPSAFPRMREMEERHGSLLGALIAGRRAARAGATPGGPLGPGGRLHSFSRGTETLVAALAARLGTALVTRARVAALQSSRAGFELALDSGPSVHAREVVLACPAAVAAAIVAPASRELSLELALLPSAPVAVVATAYAAADVAHVAPGFGFLVPGRERLPLLGTLFDSWIFPGRAPAGRVLWRTMLGGARDPGALDEPDDALLARVLTSHERLLGVRAAPELFAVIRHPRGIPQYTLGHAERLSRIEARLAELPGLRLAGNAYRGISMNACVREAEQLAEELGSRG